MEATLLHSAGKRITEFKRGLHYEQVEVTSFPIRHWEYPIPPEALDTRCMLFYVSRSQKNEETKKLLAAVCAIRKKKPLLPILILDETDNEDVARAAASEDADGYYVTPFPYRELANDIKQFVVKKMEQNSSLKWLHAFDLWLDLERHAARRKNIFIHLRNKEFALLEFFIMNRGKVLTRTSILEHVWDRNAHFASNTVDVHINRLRRKIDNPFRYKLIHTVHCIGYTFDKKNRPG